MEPFDYIEVGAGSAGAVLASRPSEDPDVRVLLVEAGGSHHIPAVQTPAAFPQRFKSPLDWQYDTHPEPPLGGRAVLQPRATMVGGCSSMSAMVYIRGSRYDFDQWANDGATGWPYDDQTGLLSSNIAEAGVFAHTHNDAAPDEELIGGPTSFHDDGSVSPDVGARLGGVDGSSS
jgi:choline dehydrogenase